MKLLPYLKGMSVADRKVFAERCETNLPHLHNIAYGCKRCAARLAVKIERETGGKVTCEELCPVVDWAFVRGTHRKRQQQSASA